MVLLGRISAHITWPLKMKGFFFSLLPFVASWLTCSYMDTQSPDICCLIRDINNILNGKTLEHL